MKQGDHLEDLRKCGDITEKELIEIGWAYVSWIYLAQDMGMWQIFMSMVMKKIGSINLGNLLTGKESIRFSRTLPVNTARAEICCHMNVRAGSMPVLNVAL